MAGLWSSSTRGPWAETLPLLPPQYTFVQHLCLQGYPGLQKEMVRLDQVKFSLDGALSNLIKL